jgi:hypothetical protein
MGPRVRWGPGDRDEFVNMAQRWREAGATHLSVDTMGSGRHSLDAHLDALAGASAALAAVG